MKVKNMKMKYLSIFIALLILFLSIGAISAAEDANDTISLDDNSHEDTLSVEEKRIEDTISIDQSTDDVKSICEVNVKKANSTSTTNSSNTTKTVTNTTVSTPDSTFLFKRNSNLKIIIKDKVTKKPIKNLKITFTIKNNKKTKTYTLKTNSKGVATFNTKKLSVGFHKFVIASKNAKYNVSKKDYIFIGNLYADTVKMGKTKKLRNGDAITTFFQKKDGQFKKGVNVDSWYTGGNNTDKSTPNAKYTKIIKAKFYFKNKKTGKIIAKKSKGILEEYDGELYRSLPHTDLIKGYKPIQTKIWYVLSKLEN